MTSKEALDKLKDYVIKYEDDENTIYCLLSELSTELFGIIERDLRMFEIIKKYYDIGFSAYGFRITAKRDFPLGLFPEEELRIINKWLEENDS